MCVLKFVNYILSEGEDVRFSVLFQIAKTFLKQMAQPFRHVSMIDVIVTLHVLVPLLLPAQDS